MQPLDAVGAAIEPIDLDHLIRQTMGDPSLEREVIDLFVDEMDRARRQLVSGMQLGRAALAHRIRGAAASIGAKALAASAAALEADPDRIDLAAALLVRMHEATAYIAERRRTNG